MGIPAAVTRLEAAARPRRYLKAGDPKRGVHPPEGYGRQYAFWSQIGTMPVNLSIKNAPDKVVQRLRQRAERHHRSLQGELLAIIEEAVRPAHELSPTDLLVEVRRLGLHTPADSTTIIRADRERH